MNNNFYSYNSEYYYEKKVKTIAQIRKHSNLVGTGVLCFLGVSVILSIFLKFFNLSEMISANEIASECFQILFSIIAIFIPFFVIMFSVKKYHFDDSFALSKPFDKSLFLSAIPAGLMLCLVGDRISTYIYVFFKNFGVELTTSHESVVPKNPSALFLFIICTSVIAPMVEEFAMRCIALQPLRKYGEKYAIIMTSIVFGLMHQNITQGIFAFMAGLVLSYFAISTGSVWCSMIIHGLNNLLSVVTQILGEQNDNIATYFYVVITVVIYILGTVGLVFFVKNKNRHILFKPEMPYIKTSEKLSAFLLSPAMLAAIIFLLINSIF